MSGPDPAPGDMEGMRGLQGIALAGRFVLELAAVAALAWWGIKTGSDDVSRGVLAVLAVGALIVVWALLIAPRARNGIPPRTRWIIGTGLLLLGPVALYSVGSVDLALLFLALVAIDTFVVLWLDAQPGA